MFNVSLLCVLLFIFYSNFAETIQPCSKVVKDKLIYNPGPFVMPKCHLRLNQPQEINKEIILEGSSANGVTINCNNATLNNYGNRAITVKSKQIKTKSGHWKWVTPENITIKNCNIIGSIRIMGLSKNGEGELIKASSRLDANHTRRAQNAAPRKIVLKNNTHTATSETPIYISPGVRNVKIMNSLFKGQANSVAIYLDAESSQNLVYKNKFHIDTNKREIIAIDGSSKNRIIANEFSSLDFGGVFLYRNCGEGGTVRHKTPYENQIIANKFYYNRYWGIFPSIHLSSRNGRRDYCHLDNGFPWGSSINDRDLAQNNVILDNQILKLPVNIMIRDDSEFDNRIQLNKSVSSFENKPSICFHQPLNRILNHSKTLVTQVYKNNKCLNIKLVCNDGLINRTVLSECN
jgi:hypothetical protein